jgi:hypothetical protein
MPAGNFDLEKLLNPHSADQFFSQYWEKEHCFLPRRDSDYFEQLMTRSDLENVISTSDMRYPAIRLAKGGGYFPPEAYTHNMRYGDESFTAVPDVQKTSAQYRWSKLN